MEIIVPIYNVEKYLEECLESIYKVKNISKEIILINDKSTDNGYKIIKEYQKKYPLETVVVNHDVNMGLSEARNSGLKVARGKYVSFIDSDDIILSEKYEDIFSLNKKYSLDIIIGNGNIYKDEIIKERFKRDKKLEQIGITTGKNLLENMIKLNSYYEMVWLHFYRKDFLLKNNFRFYKGLLHEDTLFNFLVFLKADRVKYVDVDFYLYRQREGSIMSKMSTKNDRHRLFICKKLFIKINKKQETSCYINRCIFNLYWAAFRGSKLQNKDLFYRMLFLKTNSFKIFIKKVILLISFPISIKIKDSEINEI